MTKAIFKNGFILLITALLAVSGFFIVQSANAITGLTITAPNGGEQWRGDQNITWATTGGVTGDFVDITVIDEVLGFSHEAATDIPFDASPFLWTTGTEADGTNYKIRILKANTSTVYDTSDLIFRVDNTAPVTTYAINPAAPDGTNGWYISVPTITLTCNDGTGSGCNKIYFKWNSAPIYTEYSVPFLALEGEHVLSYYSEDTAADAAGNHNEEVVGTQTIKVDTVAPAAPTITLIATDNYINTSEASTTHVVGTAEPNSTVSVILTDTNLTDASNTGTADGSGNYDIIVDTSSLLDGTITPTVNATDAAGNTGPDTNTPTAIKDTVALISSITSDATTVALLKIGDTINFTLTPSTTEDGATVSGSYNGQVLSWGTSDGGVTYTATYTVQEGDPDQTSPLQITGVTYTDAAGNTSPSADGSDITDTIDANRPTLSPVSIASDNANTSQAKIGDTVTLSFTSNEGVTNPPIVTIDGQAAAIVLSGPTVWSATYTFAGGETEGIIPFTIDFSDIAGNTGTTVSATTDVTSVNYDQTPPTAPTITSIAGDEYINAAEAATTHVVGTAESNSTVSVILTDTNLTDASNTGTADSSGNYDIIVDTSSLLDGTITPTVNATDAAGNIGLDTNTPTAIKDTVTPSITSITTKDTDEDGSVETAEIVFTEPILDSSFSGSESAFSIGGTAGTGFDTGTTADDDTVDITNGGVSGTEAKDTTYTPGTVTDFAGNPLATVTSGDVVETDQAKPVLMSAITTSTTTLDAAFSEDLNGATVNSGGDEFTVSGTTVNNADETAAGIVTLIYDALGTGATPDVTYIEVLPGSLKDLSGNAAKTPVTVTAVDGVAPILSLVSISSNNALDTSLAKSGETITLSFTSSEDIAAPTVTIDGQTASISGGLTDWTATYTMTNTDTEGIVPFTVDFEDLATPTPNNGTQVIATDDASFVLYDRTVPAVDAGTDKEVNVASAQDATISDAGSGLYTWAWSQVSGPGTALFVPSADADPNLDPDTTISADTDGTYELKLTVTDHAGNVNENTLIFIWDTTNPEPLTSIPSDGSTGVSISAGTAYVTFDEPVVLLDSSRVLLVDDTTGTSYKGAVTVDGGNPAMLDITYSGLDYGTKYRINVKPNAISDVATNELASNFISYFTTEIDTIPPVVVSSSASGITTTGATLNVGTDENATCAYAQTDSEYSSMTPFTTTGTTSHSTALTGLASSTGYDFYVRCADTSPQTNEMTTSANISFTTLALTDTTAPADPVITTSATTIDADNYTIAGTDADDGGNRTISVYNGATLAGTTVVPAGSTSWSLLVPLTQDSANVFTATASDEAGNTSASSSSVTITEATTVGDTTAPADPVITTSTATVDADTYTIEGTAGADLPSDGPRTITIYNNGVAMGSIVLPTGQNDWSFVASLSQNTDNIFTAYSTDQSGNTSGASSSVTIIEQTAADTTPPVISDIQVTSIGSDTATIAWTTDEASTSQVEYGLTSSYGSSTTADPTLTTSHSVVVSGLDSSATYHFRVLSDDASSNSATSGDNTFTATVDDSTAVLSVTGVSALNSYAIANDDYADGWSWTFNITVPTTETELQMKFSNWNSALLNVILAANNIRYSSSQASNGPIEITAADTYGNPLALTGSDLDSLVPGLQIQVLVEAKVPVDSAGGSYTTSYGIKSE